MSELRQICVHFKTKKKYNSSKADAYYLMHTKLE